MNKRRSRSPYGPQEIEGPTDAAAEYRKRKASSCPAPLGRSGSRGRSQGHRGGRRGGIGGPATAVAATADQAATAPADQPTTAPADEPEPQPWSFYSEFLATRMDVSVVPVALDADPGAQACWAVSDYATDDLGNYAGIKVRWVLHGCCRPCMQHTWADMGGLTPAAGE